MADTKLALITGAASGIGAASARALAAEGYSVAVLDRDTTLLEQQAEKLRAEGADVLTIPVDLLDAEAVADGIDAAGRHAPLRGVVHAAGVFDVGTAADIDEASWDRLVDIKLKGAFLVSKAAIPLIAAAGGGGIVHIASMSGRTKSVFTAPSYGAANGGIIGLTMTLAAQSAPLGVRVNAIAPGLVNTPMSEAYRAALGDERMNALPAAIPLGRFAEPTEIADVAVFLISEKASYITGETINVNGGMFMC
ncbi:SDR family oxidoreductase [Pseudonocardia sp. C8]|uniref:SDR family NAD(P)-dependent oxidoreductase n=1 Tax=Pseudonocardia sp. C8 TaxID=2762759 RepID=UPI001642D397|nr:SDR family NAD(P)-dependent oxidoreductase [Pseudonocardia sp. C8]MBC3191849.1 SDR family oxidoreductase [Pseudonocardia sp. C8]